MAIYKAVATATPDAASNTSLTSAFAIPTEYEQFAIRVPPLFAITATCGIKILGAATSTGETFLTVMYGNSPATTTSNTLISNWESPHSAACTGAYIICEGMAFVPGWAKLQFTATATMNTNFVIYGRKKD